MKKEEESVTKEDITEIEKPKTYWFWMKNSKGEASASLTFMSVAFVVTTLVYILSIFETLGPITIRNFDVAAAGVYFVPLLSLYFGRRFTQARYSESNNK